MNATFRPAHIGSLKFGQESGNLAHDATALGAAPALSYMGYGDIPNVTINEGSQLVHAVGTPNGVDLVYGDRDISFRVRLKLGNLEFIRYCFRGSGVGGATAYGLPILALSGAAANNYAGKGFTWLCRYCLCSNFRLTFGETSATPVTFEGDFVALAVDEAGALQTVDDNQLLSAGGRVLTWSHSDIVFGSTSFRDLISNGTISVNNNVKPEGRRPDLGVLNPLSRIPYELIPHQNDLTSQFSMKDKLPSQWRGEFDDLYLRADNTASGATSPKSLSVRLHKAMISNQTLNQAEVGNPFSFSSSFVNRVLSITTSGA